MGDIATFLLVTGAIAAALCLLVAIATLAIRWARRGSASASFVGWALLLPSAGMNPQPPPQEQVDQVNRDKKIKKDAESGEPND